MSGETRRFYRPPPPDPIDERGSHVEAEKTPRESKPPPPRLDSMTFPINRLPQLDVPIIKRLPDVGLSHEADQHDLGTNLNIDPNLPLPIVPEKTMFNLWEKTQTQTEVKWSRPENAGHFSSMLYQIDIKSGESGEWQRLTENYQPVYRVYFAEGKALFGRTHLTQDATVTMMTMTSGQLLSFVRALETDKADAGTKPSPASGPHAKQTAEHAEQLMPF